MIRSRGWIFPLENKILRNMNLGLISRKCVTCGIPSPGPPTVICYCSTSSPVLLSYQIKFKKPKHVLPCAALLLTPVNWFCVGKFRNSGKIFHFYFRIIYFSLSFALVFSNINLRWLWIYQIFCYKLDTTPLSILLSEVSSHNHWSISKICLLNYILTKF